MFLWLEQHMYKSYKIKDVTQEYFFIINNDNDKDIARPGSRHTSFLVFYDALMM